MPHFLPEKGRSLSNQQLLAELLAALQKGRSLSNQQLLDFCEASPSVEAEHGFVDLIVPFLLNNLVGQQHQHQDSRRLSLCVGCLALVVEHAAETDRILGLETNTTQLVRLCLNRGVYPEASPLPHGQMSADPVPTPVQEVAICHRALGQLLCMGPISGSSVVRTDVVGFVRKWFQRLSATAEATGSSSPRRGSALRFEMPSSSSSCGGGGGGREVKAAVPTLRAVLQLLVVLVSTRHPWLMSHIDSVMRDLDPSFLRAYVQCSDAATASAAASLLVLLLQCACEGEGASWVVPAQDLAAHRMEQLAYRDGEAEAGLALSLLRLVCEGSARSQSSPSPAPGTPAAVLALLHRSIESQRRGEQSALTTFYALRWCHLAQQPFSQCLQALDREALAAAQQGMLALRAFSSPDDAANMRLAAEYAVDVSHALAGRSPMVSSPVPPSQGGMESPPLTQRRDSGCHWSYPDSVSRHQGLASLDTTRMSEEEASDMNLSSRHSPPGSGLVRKQQQEDGLHQQQEEKEEEKNEKETSDELEDDAGSGWAGRVGALQADNAQLRRHVLELQRELHRRDADAERDKSMRAEQTALLEDAWAKMSSVARAEAAAQAELQSAQAWAAVCQDRLLEREEICASLSADAAQAAGQVHTFEMRAKEEARRSAASVGSEAALREALSRAERHLEVQRDVEARLVAEVNRLEGEKEADAHRLHGCERALAAEQDMSAAGVKELAACREQLLRCERSLQAESDRASAMATELNTHRSIISHIHASINQLGGKTSKGPADNLDLMVERLSQSLSQGVSDHHKENAKNVV